MAIQLLPLRTRQATHAPRAGSLTFAPQTFGDTKWHDLALQHRLEHEQQYLDRAASVENVRRLAPRADVVAFYAHGKHIDGQAAMQRNDDRAGPSLALAGGDKLALSDLTTEWVGVERVELWGCEAGVSRSMDPVPVVAERREDLARVPVLAALVLVDLPGLPRESLGDGREVVADLQHRQRAVANAAAKGVETSTAVSASSRRPGSVAQRQLFHL